MSTIPLASMAPPAKHKPIGITTLVIRSCERKAQSSQSNERDSIVRERARERGRAINTLQYTAASRRDIYVDAYRSALLQVHEPLLALEKLRGCFARRVSAVRLSSVFERAASSRTQTSSIVTASFPSRVRRHRASRGRRNANPRHQRSVSAVSTTASSRFVARVSSASHTNERYAPFAPRQSYRSSSSVGRRARALEWRRSPRWPKTPPDGKDSSGGGAQNSNVLQNASSSTALTNLHAPRRFLALFRTIPTPLTPLALDAHLTPSRAATVTLSMRRAEPSIGNRSKRPVIVPSERPAYHAIERVRSDRRRASVRRVRRRSLLCRFPSRPARARVGVDRRLLHRRLRRCRRGRRGRVARRPSILTAAAVVTAVTVTAVVVRRRRFDECNLFPRFLLIVPSFVHPSFVPSLVRSFVPSSVRPSICVGATSTATSTRGTESTHAHAHTHADADGHGCRVGRGSGDKRPFMTRHTHTVPVQIYSTRFSLISIRFSLESIQ